MRASSYPKLYKEFSGRVVKADNRFKHVMSLALHPYDRQKGLVRCILSRVGNIRIKGYIDRSELHLIKGNFPYHYVVGERLKINGEEEMIKELERKNWESIGLEDPDIWYDPDDQRLHIYFTIPLRAKRKGGRMRIYLGHAEGNSLNSLRITEPVLTNDRFSAKEVAIAPKNTQDFRYNLFESSDKVGKTRFSTIRVAIAKQASPPWEFGKTVFHPAKQGFDWCAGHASPGPLLPKTFIDLGKGKCLGIINGREANKQVGEKTFYGVFSVGLMIYNYERGEIEWVSPRPFIRDPQAKTITFASQFVETAPGQGVLYAHIDDSFVRAYCINANSLKLLLPN